MGLYAFPCARASNLKQQICISPAPGRSSKLTHTGVEIDTCAFQTGCQLSSAATGMSLELRFLTQFQWREAYVLDNWQLGSCLSLEVVSSIPAGSRIIYRFLCGFICVSLCQSIKIKPTNMYIASARAQFKINTHRCWNWHLCIPDGLSVVQCSHGHVIGVAFFDAISVAWSVRAGQLAAGGVASVWRSWVRSPPGPR